MATAPEILIAAPQAVVDTLANGLSDVPVRVCPGVTYAEAEACLDRPLALIVVCYVFDDLRPYRFVHRIKEVAKGRTPPILLIRALPVPLGESQEWEIRQAYKSIGVAEFLNYSKLLHDEGSAKANERLRECVRSLLSPKTQR